MEEMTIGDANSSSELSTMSTIRVSSEGSLAPESETEPASEIEVYEFPHDCVASELSFHFSRRPYFAASTTPLRTMWNHKSSTFVLQFTPKEAEKIAQDPVQLLDKDDPNSEIRVGVLDARRKAQVLVTCEYEMNYRMIKQFFSGFGELNSCQQPYGMLGDYRIIVTFKDPSVAEKVCSVGNHTIGPVLSVHTQLLKNAVDLIADEPPSPTGTSLTLDFDMDSVSCLGMPPFKEKLNKNAKKESRDDDSYIEFLEEDNPLGERKPLLTLSSSSDHLRERSDTEVSHTPYTSIISGLTDDTHYETIDLNQLLQNMPCEKSPPSAGEETASPPPVAERSIRPSTPLPHLPTPVVNLHLAIQVNNCVIRLVEGSITEHAADVIVHSRGSVGRALWTKVNSSSKTPVNTVDMIYGRKHGNIHITTAPNLAAQYIMHFRLADFDGGESMKYFVKLCLKQCDLLKVKSVAFVALGTGDYGQSPKMMASLLVQIIVDYMKAELQSTIEIIDLVIYQSNILTYFITPLRQVTAISKLSSISKMLNKSSSRLENIYQVPNKPPT